MPAKCRQWQRNAAFVWFVSRIRHHLHHHRHHHYPVATEWIKFCVSHCRSNFVIIFSPTSCLPDLLHLYCNVYFVVLHKFPTNPLWRHQRERNSLVVWQAGSLTAFRRPLKAFVIHFELINAVAKIFEHFYRQPRYLVTILYIRNVVYKYLKPAT